MGGNSLTFAPPTYTPPHIFPFPWESSNNFVTSLDSSSPWLSSTLLHIFSLFHTACRRLSNHARRRNKTIRQMKGSPLTIYFEKQLAKQESVCISRLHGVCLVKSPASCFILIGHHAIFSSKRLCILLQFPAPA